MSKPITPNWETEVVSVTGKYGNPIKFYSEGFGNPLWVYRDSTGIVGIVQARTREDAYECVLDELLRPIPESEVCEAYGYCDQAEMDQDRADYEKAGEDFCPELVEGYQYQANSTGTGIVSIDLNGEVLDELTVDMLRHLEINIRIRRI